MHAAPGLRRLFFFFFFSFPVPDFDEEASSRGYGQYRQSLTHPRGLCEECSWHLEVVRKVHCVVAVRLLAGHQASYLQVEDLKFTIVEKKRNVGRGNSPYIN
eukprot:1151125-Pelagomonas_calceolata.AAC.1